MDLVITIVDLLEDYDPYSFMEAYECNEEAIESVTSLINEHEYDSLLEELTDMKNDDSYENEKLDYAIEKLKLYKELDEYIKKNYNGIN